MKFCPNCAAQMQFALDNDGGKKCATCEVTHWQNPLPVGVALLPIYLQELGQFGLIIGKRGDGVTHSGGWALPSGFMLRGERWEAATAREVFEELNIKIKEDAKFTVEGVFNSDPNPSSLMIFSSIEPQSFEVGSFIQNREVEEKSIYITGGEVELCFSTHRFVADKFLNRINHGRTL